MVSRVQTDVDHVANHIFGKEVVADLGRPQTPRKTADGSVEASRPVWDNTLGSEHTLVASGRGHVASHASAPVAESVGLLSTQTESFPRGKSMELSSPRINEGAQVCAYVDIFNQRKQLMLLGLFPPDLYRVGESFEEKHLRYTPTSSTASDLRRRVVPGTCDIALLYCTRSVPGIGKCSATTS